MQAASELRVLGVAAALLLGCSLLNTVENTAQDDAGEGGGPAAPPSSAGDSGGGGSGSGGVGGSGGNVGSSGASSGGSTSTAMPEPAIHGDTAAQVLDANVFKGADINRGYGIARDGDDLYLTGVFKQSISFSEEGVVHASDGEYDIYLVKLDAGHDELWSRTFGGSLGGPKPGGYDFGLRVAVAGKDVLLLGACTNALELDTFTVCRNGAAGFVAKLSGTEDGIVQWATELPGVSAPSFDARPRGLVVDEASGDVYVTGRYDIAFETGDPESTLEEVGPVAAYVIKLTSSGDLTWARSVKSSGPAAGLALALDAEGDVLCAGFVTGPSDVAGDAVGATGGTDAFVTKLSPDGEHRFTQRYNGPGDDEASALAIVGDDEILVAGKFEQELILGETEELGIGDARTGVFLVRLDREGALVAIEALGTGVDQTASPDPIAAAVVALGDGFAVTGTFEDTLSYQGETRLRAGQNDDVYVARFSARGLEWSVAVGAQELDSAHDMIVDADGTLLVAGHLTALVQLDEMRTVDAGPRYSTLLLRIAP